MKTGTLLALGWLACAAAYAQTATVESPGCMPVEQNGVVRAGAATTATGQSVRLYFRWKEERDAKEQKAFYWVAMEPGAGGRYWAIPPKPEKRNTAIEMYSAVVDPTGKAIARSELQTVKVTSSCQPQLSPQERGVAENLTIGETAEEQQKKKVLGFLCDGIATRINFESIRRADEQCRACIVAWWRTPAVLVPSLLGVAGVVSIVTHHHPPEPQPSPSRP